MANILFLTAFFGVTAVLMDARLVGSIFFLTVFLGMTVLLVPGDGLGLMMLDVSFFLTVFFGVTDLLLTPPFQSVGCMSEVVRVDTMLEVVAIGAAGSSQYYQNRLRGMVLLCAGHVLFAIDVQI